MYSFDPRRLLGLSGRHGAHVGKNVVLLGLTSMLTDVSSEMVASILPIYLVLAIGLSPAQFGFVDGIAQLAAAFARISSGRIADRWRRNREVAAAGYGLSALCKLLMLAAGTSWGFIAGVLAADKIGKAIRTSPRDALIAQSADPTQLGLAFGVHRALDTAGALLGPAIAFLILVNLPLAYDLVFVASFGFALVGLAVLLCFVRNVAAPSVAAVAEPSKFASMGRIWRTGGLSKIASLGFVFGLVTVADSFFFLLLQRKMAIEASSFPLLYTLTALSYLVLAVPMGRWADRIGRGRVFLIGHVVLLLATLNLMLMPDGIYLGLVALGLLGAYFACTDGVLMAAASGRLPDESRATGVAMVTTAVAVARLLASMLFGYLWSRTGVEWALGLFLCGLAAALILMARPILRLDELMVQAQTTSTST